MNCRCIPHYRQPSASLFSLSPQGWDVAPLTAQPPSRWGVSHYAALLCTPGCLWGYNYQSSCNPSCPCIWSLVAFGVVLEVFPPLLAMTQFEAFEGWRVNSQGFYGDGWHPDWSSRLHCPQPIKLSTLSCLHWLCECIFSLCDAFCFPSGLRVTPSVSCVPLLQGSWFDFIFFSIILVCCGNDKFNRFEWIQQRYLHCCNVQNMM